MRNNFFFSSQKNVLSSKWFEMKTLQMLRKFFPLHPGADGISSTSKWRGPPKITPGTRALLFHMVRFCWLKGGEQGTAVPRWGLFNVQRGLMDVRGREHFTRTCHPSFCVTARQQYSSFEKVIFIYVYNQQSAGDNLFAKHSYGFHKTKCTHTTQFDRHMAAVELSITTEKGVDYTQPNTIWLNNQPDDDIVKFEFFPSNFFDQNVGRRINPKRSSPWHFLLTCIYLFLSSSSIVIWSRGGVPLPPAAILIAHTTPCYYDKHRDNKLFYSLSSVDGEKNKK